MGSRIFDSHTCASGKQAIGPGYHGRSCHDRVGRWSRHAALNNIFYRALATDNVLALLESNSVACDDGRCPDRMTLIPCLCGESLVLYVTCVDTLAASHLTNTTKSPSSALEAAEPVKRRNYATRNESYIFVLFPVETLGSWDLEDLILHKETSKRLI